MCTKDKIRVQPNKKYYVYCGKSTNFYNYAVFYDKNNNFLGNCLYITNDADYCIKSPENAYYMNVTFGQDYGDTYNHDICISENVWNENWENGVYGYIWVENELKIILKDENNNTSEYILKVKSSL